MVTRVRGSHLTGQYSGGTTHYFVWAEPDTAPEYETEEEARAKLK